MYLSESVYESGELIVARVSSHLVCREAMFCDRIDITPGHAQLTN